MIADTHEHGAGSVGRNQDHYATEQIGGSGERPGGRIEWDLHRVLRRRASTWSILAAAGLVVVYVGLLALANSLEHALGEFQRLWYWMVPLILGFAAQVGLFAYARTATRGEGSVHARGVAASGGTSTLSMVACCAHHLTDVLPLIGLAGAAMFLAQYQNLFLLLGVLSNVVGLVYVLGLLHQHGLYPRRASLLSLCARWPLHRALPAIAIVCGLVFVAAVIVTVVQWRIDR
jgi:hypothetical protein